MEENVFILDVDYDIDETDSKPVIRIFGKTDKGKTILVLHKEFMPYFYVLPKEGKLEQLKKEIEKLNLSGIDVKEIKTEVVEKILGAEKTKLLKITINNPHKIPDGRKAVKELPNVADTFEYDIPFYKRYLIDNNLIPLRWVAVGGEPLDDKENFQVDIALKVSSLKQIEIKKEPHIKTLAYDIELVEEKGKETIIMISLAGNNRFKKVLTAWQWDKKQSYVEVLKNEKELIERFVQIVKEEDPDFLVDYNGDRFDLPKLISRAKELRVNLALGRNSMPVIFVKRGRDESAKIKGRVHFDLFVFVEHALKAILKSETLTLDNVATELLGVGKKKLKYSEMREIWGKKDHVEKIAEYSMWDSELTLMLSDYLMPQIYALSRLTGQLPFDVSRSLYSQLVEIFYVRQAFKDNVVVPNRPRDEEIASRREIPKYKGAIVFEPKAGIHSNILVFDFRSLYPTIIVSHNISPETFNCPHKECEEKNVVPETKNHFCTKTKGFISGHLEEVLKERQKIKTELKKVKKGSQEWKELDNLQGALKIVANATYGYFAYFGAKWYRRECGEATAAFGRYYITKVMELAKNAGFEIIYGDTDSLMIRSATENKTEKLKELGEKFAEKITKELPGIIELEFRGIYESGIFVTLKRGEKGAKKRYALIDYDGAIEIRGFETVRRDWCELAKKIQREVLTIILKEKNPEKAMQLIKKTIKDLKEGNVKLEDLAILEQITRPLSKYEQIGPHVKAAMKAQKRGRVIVEGTLISFVITKGSGSISDRAEPVEDVKLKDYDPTYYIEHQVVPAAFRVMDALGYKEDDLLGKKQFKLTHF